MSQGRLDLTGLPESRAAARTLLVWGASLRRPDRVLGRSPELAALDAWQASAGRVLAVVGLPGIGKTSLVAHWALDRRASGHVFWHELHESSTPATVLADLGAFLARIGRRGLAAYLSEPARLDVGLAARTLEHSMRGLSVLLILDGLERASGDVARLVAALLPGIQASPSRLLVTSRTLPKFLADLEAKGPDAAVILRLKGLAPDASADLLRAKGMYADEATLARIASLTRGHPLLLSLAAQGGAVASGTIEHYLEREIWTSLADGERNALELASVLRAAMPLEAFQEFARLPESALFGLRSKNLLEPTITGAHGALAATTGFSPATALSGRRPFGWTAQQVADLFSGVKKHAHRAFPFLQVEGIAAQSGDMDTARLAYYSWKQIESDQKAENWRTVHTWKGKLRQIPDRLADAIWRPFFRATVGYGVFPQLLLIWLFVLLGVGALAFSLGTVRPTDSQSPNGLEAFTASISNLLPGSQPVWEPTNEYWAIAILVHRVLAWLIGAIGLLAIGGVLRRYR